MTPDPPRRRWGNREIKRLEVSSRVTGGPLASLSRRSRTSGVNGTLTIPGPVGSEEASVMEPDTGGGVSADAGGGVGAGLAGREVTGTGLAGRETAGFAGGTLSPGKMP